MRELDVLTELIDELLGEGIRDADDALELAIHVGLAARLGAEPSALQAAETWRSEGGQDLLDAAWDAIDLDDLVDAIDGVDPEDEPEAIEDVLYDFDDVVAAAVWCGRRDLVEIPARKVATLIRQVPDPFAPVSSAGSDMMRLPAVAGELSLYDFWQAVADAAVWLDAESA